MPRVRDNVDSIGSHRLVHGDCLDELTRLPSHSVACVITDPPYGTTEDGASKVIKRGNEITEFGEDWDRSLPLEWLAETRRLVVPGGAVVAFTDTKRVGDVWDEFKKVDIRPLQLFFWVKDNPPPNPRQNFVSAVEAAVFGRTRGKVYCWNGGGWSRNVFQCPIVSGERLHRTQKPLALMKHLVGILSNKGDVILDPFCGSATTGQACCELGRQFIGIEMSEASYEVSRRRLRKVLGLDVIADDDLDWEPTQLR